MKLFFAGFDDSPLLHPQSTILLTVKKTILDKNLAEETKIPEGADAIIVQENDEYKDCRYSEKLVQDRFIHAHLNKIFTISNDDSATGLLRGLYASIPKKRFDQRYHKAVPYLNFANEYVFSDKNPVEPQFLAGWYGNIKSNNIRRVLLERWKDHPDFCIRQTQSWYNHKKDEQRDYVELIKNSKFSLCPAGWAPPSPRIYESMALGRCPVIISDQFVEVEGPKWREFALFYPEKCVSKIDSFLLEHESQYKLLGAKAKENWDTFFAGDLLKVYYANSLLTLIRATPRYSKEQEIRRWQSFSTYWNNNWTIPQRVLNKCNRMLKQSKVL